MRANQKCADGQEGKTCSSGSPKDSESIAVGTKIYFTEDRGYFLPVIKERLSDVCSACALLMGLRLGMNKDSSEASEIVAHSKAPQTIRLLCDVHAHEIFHGGGVFNSDPHAGNVIAMDDGRLGLVDYGVTVTLTDKQRAALARLIIAITDKDDEGIVKAMISFGFSSQENDPRSLLPYALMCFHRGMHPEDMLRAGIPENMHPFDVADYLRSFDVMEHLEPHVLAVRRCTTSLLGLAKAAGADGMSLADIWRPHAEQYLLNHGYRAWTTAVPNVNISHSAKPWHGYNVPLRPQNDVEARSLAEFRRVVQALLKDAEPGTNLGFVPSAESYDFCSDDTTLLRFLRARDHEPGPALSLLLRTLQWRETEQPRSVRCPKCADNPLSHNMRVIGFDKLGRPVLYTCFSQAHDRWEPTANVKHLIATMEHTQALINERGLDMNPSGKWVWFVDFDGYSWADNNPQTTLLCAQMLHYYPERLGQCVLFGAPWLFGSIWRLVRPLLNEVTASKVLFLAGSADSPSQWSPALEEHWPTNLVQWTVAEMQENRLQMSPVKEYWSTVRSDGSAKSHDSRAEKSFVQSPWFVLPVEDIASSCHSSESEAKTESCTPF